MDSRNVCSVKLMLLSLALTLLIATASDISMAQAVPPGQACPVGGYAIVACPVVNDQVIKAAVQTRLAGSVVAPGGAICIQVTGGVVTLSGQVENPNRLQLATLLASSVRGVVCVNNQLTVLRYNTPESSLAIEVRNRLSKSPLFRGQTIGVQASEGVVRLTGIVDTEDAREAATDIVSGVPGVTAVQNALTVRLPWTE